MLRPVMQFEWLARQCRLAIVTGTSRLCLWEPAGATLLHIEGVRHLFARVVVAHRVLLREPHNRSTMLGARADKFQAARLRAAPSADALVVMSANTWRIAYFGAS
jgi:hypothetical protein